MVIEPAEWTNKVGDVTVSSRQQIPLRLAWALSVHKSQGMTIPHLAVSLRGVFEYGQAYVALSRSTRLDLLTLRGFDRRAFRAHPKVKEFYRLLEGGGGRGRAPGGAPGGVPKGAAREGPQAQELPPPPRTYGRQATALVATTNYSGARSSSLSSKSPPRNLTDGQRSRMEENRRRALARKQQKQAAGAGGGPANPYAAGVSPPSASSRSSSSSGGRTTPPPRNPYAR